MCVYTMYLAENIQNLFSSSFFIIITPSYVPVLFAALIQTVKNSETGS